MPPISEKSRSFMRHDSHGRDYSIGVNIDREFFHQNKKSVLKEWIITFHNDKAVIGADKLNFRTLEEIRKIKLELKSVIESELKERELTQVQGILDIHPTGDRAEKSAHIHWWGSEAKIVASIIAQYVSENNLSRYRNIERLNLTWGQEKKFTKEVERKIETKDKKSTLNEEQKKIKTEEEIEKDELLEDINNNLYFLKTTLDEAKKYMK